MHAGWENDIRKNPDPEDRQMTGSKLRVPCTYQGGKQRLAGAIVDVFFAENKIGADTRFYDLCCGSGAISIELVNRGISPQNISMLDISSWGAFWAAVGHGTFDMEFFDSILSGLPDDKREYKKHLEGLVSSSSLVHEAELYPILQANSFGGKQITTKNGEWDNACFRDYWEPTANSVRRSPANPMQPSPTELKRRVTAIVRDMVGANGIRGDIMSFFSFNVAPDSIVYVDPPYMNTTGYSYMFNIKDFIQEYKAAFQAPLYISENVALGHNATKLQLHGANGGITGSRKSKHEEWLSRF